MESEKEGLIIAITGPSGAGKTTYSKKLVEYYSTSARKSIVYTTRNRRPNEQEGVQYFFVDNSKFEEMKKSGLFACYTNFCENMYGIEKSYINQVTKVEKKDLIFDTIMEIEDLKSLGNNVVIIYLTSSTDELINRIIKRDPSIDLNELELRKKDFNKQSKNASKCNYVIDTSSNRTEDEILEDLVKVIEHFKLKCNK